MTVLYERRGRRYEAVASHQLHDVMRLGQFRLAYCYRDGAVRYAYDVRPDTAAFVAAAEVARAAMEDAITALAAAKPSGSIPYTPPEQALIEEFRSRANDIGMAWPTWWQHSTPRDLSEAAINAVRNYRP